MGYFSDLNVARTGGGYTLSPDYEMAMYLKNHVVDGGIVIDGGSFAQVDETSITPDFDYTAISAVVNGVWGHLVAGTLATAILTAAHPTSMLKATTNTTVVLTIVLKRSSAAVPVFALQVVPGVSGTAATAVAPGVKVIDAAVTHKDWIYIANVVVTRTGATACTGVYDNKPRPVFNGAIEM